MKTNKTLKKRIHTYIAKKGNVCCEDDLNRDIIIEQIFDVYLKIATFYSEKEYYLSFVTNDLVKFIGYLVQLKNMNDKEGIKTWKYLSKLTKNVDEKGGKEKLINVLKSIPLYILLSLLGYGHNRIVVEQVTKTPLLFMK
jgi:hypothetical protein